MSYNQKILGGLFNGLPSYKVLNSKPKSEMAVELIQQEENKFWAVRPLYILAFMQTIFGVFLCSAQLALNSKNCECNKVIEDVMRPIIGDPMFEEMRSDDEIYLQVPEIICHCSTRTFGLWCGGVIFLSGLLSALATKYRTNFLLVVSSFLCVVGYGVSICCLIMSAVYIQLEYHNNETYRGALAAMAVISGLNFFVSVLTSAFFCRASCSCCQPHTPAVMYLSSVDASSTHQHAEYVQA